MTFIDPSSISSVRELNEALILADDGIVCISSKANFQTLDSIEITAGLASADIIHCGLLFEGKSAFEHIQLITFNWNFLTPDHRLKNYSWKATSDFIIFEKKILNTVTGFDQSFESLNAALMDFSYRVMAGGGKVLYDPSFMKLPPHGNITIPKSDEVVFVKKHFPQRAFVLYKLLRFAFTMKKAVNRQTDPDIVKGKLVGEKKRDIDKFTAIIPTINRYDYLDKAIQSLLDAEFPPAEIIVVDQTPVANRIEGYYNPFLSHDHISVIYLDVAGQSISRNTGIDRAKYEWIYLFDDDSICWKDCLREHKYLIEHSMADCSTGLSLSPGQTIESIQSINRFYRSADVLDTGNCFIRKQVLLAVGKIDDAFNRGPGADDDLGKRLFLAGYSIILNPKAIRLHYKASVGGLRQHGAWWRNKSSLFGAYPPPTQLYSIEKYYPAKFRTVLIISLILKAKNRYSSASYFLFLILLPFKIFKSVQELRRLSFK
ncbi:MAG: glycosyltransferase family 2 protein [Cyclobacteriaceae bacterium]|nr:glycosyltransferase family 2 protein [Cyclobacteriaceae bacterium]